MGIQVFELNHVAIHVSDLNRSIQFYGETLGLPQIARPAFAFPGAWFSLGSQELHLIADWPPPGGARQHHHFALRVPNAFDARKHLEARGVTGLRGPAPRPDGPMQLFFNDPDGYSIEMYSLPDDDPRS